MAEITVQLPYYNIMVATSANETALRVTVKFDEDDFEDGLPGYTHDDIALAIQTALEGLTGVTDSDLSIVDQMYTPV